MHLFFKNGHKYTKDYALEATTLGADITRWWDEITSTDNTKDICFGGPTGIYTLIVLMSWWSTLLKGQPDTRLTDLIRTLEEIDRAICAAVQDARNQSTTSLPDRSSPGMPAVPPHQTRGAKRPIPEQPTSRKRLRREKV